MKKLNTGPIFPIHKEKIHESIQQLSLELFIAHAQYINKILTRKTNNYVDRC